MFSRAFSKIGLLLAILSAVLMTACGGGSGSPSQWIGLQLSESKMAYGPITMRIHGGSPPFEISTNSSGIQFPERTNSRTVYGFVYPHAEDGRGEIYVWDKLQGYSHRSRATFDIVALHWDAPTLTVTRDPAFNCSGGDLDRRGPYEQVCAGSQAVVELQLYSPGAANQNVRFRVQLGEFDIRDANTGTWGSSAITHTDSLGKAQVAIQTRMDARTHVATIYAELSGNEIYEASFIIVGSDFRVFPDMILWEGAGSCPSRTAGLALYGGSPPYTVQAARGTLTSAGVAPSVVSASGGTVVLTVSGCGMGELVAQDSERRTITVPITYAQGTAPDPGEEPELPTPPVVITVVGAQPPAGPYLTNWGTATAAGRIPCGNGSIFDFTVAGGVSPYTAFVSPDRPARTISMAGPVGQMALLAALGVGDSRNIEIFVVDNEGRRASRMIYCQP